MKRCLQSSLVALMIAAAACAGPDASLDPPVMRAVDGIEGWTRTGPPDRYAKDGLYGYIDGGAELVLEYGFRELAVFTFEAASSPAGEKELVLEIYRMESGPAAFGLYSSKLEGGEEGASGITADSWIGAGQGSLVKGDLLVNVVAPGLPGPEIGAVLGAVDPKLPARRTIRPKGLERLPAAGMVPSSRRFIRGPVAARNESPFLEGDFWGFGGGGPGTAGSQAFSAKYGAVPAVSKLVVVELAASVDAPAVDAGMASAFEEYLEGVAREADALEGRNAAGRWFLYRRKAAVAGLVLGDPDRAAASGRIEAALGGTGRPKPFVVVTFDTEDYVTPESERIDDIPKWLAETMTEEGVTGTFFVIGEKARSLERRGRRDVIAAMAGHDIGSHTDRGSIHPTVTEQLERAGWEDGVRLMREQESAGLRELERIFGIPVETLARHGGSYGPQLVAALGGLGAGYQGSPVSLPGHDVVWFCNALNFSNQYANGFDDTYYRDDLFEPAFDKLKAEFPEVVRRSQVIALFAGHPTKIRAEEFWDLNFYGGTNTPPEAWRIPRLRPRETMATAQKNFRRMMRWLKGRDDVEVTTYRRPMEVYGRQKEELTRDDLRAAAGAALRNKALAPTDDLSPAEIFAGLAGAIADHGEKGRLPAASSVVHALGPLDMPPAEPGLQNVPFEAAVGSARAALEHIARTGALPPALDVTGTKIGAGSLFALFCAVYLDLDAGRTQQAYDIPAFEPYPRTHAARIIAEIEGYKGWPVHKPDLDMSRIAEFTKLQLWTLKPARRR